AGGKFEIGMIVGRERVVRRQVNAKNSGRRSAILERLFGFGIRRNRNYFRSARNARGWILSAEVERNRDGLRFRTVVARRNVDLPKIGIGRGTAHSDLS